MRDSPAGKTMDDHHSTGTPWRENGILWEYAKESKPTMSPVPVQAWDAKAHEEGESRVIHLDLSKDLETPWPATSPNQLASFVRIKAGEAFATEAQATSQVFYVIRRYRQSEALKRLHKPIPVSHLDGWWHESAEMQPQTLSMGDGYSHTSHGQVQWRQGDVWVFPGSEKITHHASKESTEHGGAAFYWVTDEPLCKYLGVTSVEEKFEPAHFTKESLVAAVKQLADEPESKEKNRIGVLLGTKQTQATKTLTHVMWVLFNVLPAGTTQKPHRHTPTALDFAITAPSKGVYTAMARSIDKEGNLIDPVKAPWKTGGAFTTPPGWWHSHVNETDEDAWVLPVQDAGLFTYQRVLDIKFVPAVLNTIKKMEAQGATFEGEKVYVDNK
ncbi:hypothetical protein ABBQ38_006170 [Trebouxia sp. C0009 RCD-2024]